MGNLVGKLATIGVDSLSSQELYLGDPVEILEQREEDFFLGKRVVVKVKSLKDPKIVKEVFRSEIVFVRPKPK